MALLNEHHFFLSLIIILYQLFFKVTKQFDIPEKLLKIGPKNLTLIIYSPLTNNSPHLDNSLRTFQFVFINSLKFTNTQSDRLLQYTPPVGQLVLPWVVLLPQSLPLH